MRVFKNFGMLAVVVLALGGIGAASASAQFTATATGSIAGKALETQVFTTYAGQVKCNIAETSGTIASTASTEQHVTVNYKECTGFGAGIVHISPATYLFTASGQVDLINTITINVTEKACHQTIGPQTVGMVQYSNNSGKLKLTPHLIGITYTSSGGTCGVSSSNGTIAGGSEWERVGGGSLSYDPPPAPGLGQFTTSATGSIAGKALETQVFTTNAGQVKCTNAATSGTITSTASTEQHVTTNYSGCTAFGFANAHISPATYLFTANGQVDLKNTITINSTVGCHQTIAPQTVSGVKYSNNGSRLRITPHVFGITYTSTGGFCGASGSNGTFTGATEWERVGGGSLTYDAPPPPPVGRFTYSATGSIIGKALETQIFTTNAGQVKCTNAATSGTITSTAPTEQHVTTNYSGCTAFGFANVHISPATYLFTASGQAHLKSPVTINVTVGGCHQTIPAQTVGGIKYSNNVSRLKVTPHITGITYTATGGLCGTSGSNGTFTGTNEWERLGGGSISYDP